MQTINCPSCQAPIATPEIKVDILNGLENSVMIYHHHAGLDCTSCGAYLIPCVMQVEATIGYTLTQKPKDAPRIISPLRRALKNLRT